MRSQVWIEFEYNLQGDRTAYLQGSEDIGDQKFLAVNLPDEFQSKLYSFSPWWSGVENRTMIFLADVVTNKLFFYAKFDALPQHYMTTLHDNDDVISVYGDNKYYRYAGGKWFIQLRPDFTLADMLK